MFNIPNLHVVAAFTVRLSALSACRECHLMTMMMTMMMVMIIITMIMMMITKYFCYLLNLKIIYKDISHGKLLVIFISSPNTCLIEYVEERGI